MGLDSFFRMSPEDGSPPHFDINVNLCGGMFSGNGTDGSFRGKVYNDFIEEVTGESLYQEWIPNEIIRVMADNLKPYLNSEDKEESELALLFLTAADEGYGLAGWW